MGNIQVRLNLITFLLLWYFPFTPIGVLGEIEPVNLTVVINSNISLPCTIGNNTGDVRWELTIGSDVLIITTCNVNGICSDINNFASPYAYYSGSRNSTVSILTIGVTTKTPPLHKCVSVNAILKSFSLVIITQEDIQPPRCHVPRLSNSSENDNYEILFTCEAEVLDGITQSLTLHNISGRMISESQTRVERAVSISAFNNTTSSYCYLDFSELEETRECIFPFSNAVDQKTNKGDKEFKCDFDEDSVGDDYKIGWRLLDSNSEDMSISDRAWTRDGGRYMLLLDVTEDDDGRVVECQVYQKNDSSSVRSIGFTVISVSEDDGFTTEHTNVTNDTPESTDTRSSGENGTKKSSPFMVAMIVMLLLFLITLSFGVYCFAPRKNNCNACMSPTLPCNESPSSENVISPSDSGKNTVHMDTIRAADIANKNNSSSNDSIITADDYKPSVEGVSSGLQSTVGEVNNPLYQVLEKSSPSSSHSTLDMGEQSHSNGQNLYTDIDSSGYDVVGVRGGAKGEIDDNMKSICEYEDIEFKGRNSLPVTDISGLYTEVRK